MPYDEKTAEVVGKIRLDDEIFVEYKPKRNYKNHKRFFSMLQSVIYNTDYYKSVDELLSMLKLKTGHFEIVVSHRGETLYIPKSIDFSSMPEDEFREFFSSCIDVLLEFMPEESVNSILNYC